MTDVTGFGLLGHLSEVCQASGVAARLSLDAIPLLDCAMSFAQSGINTGAGSRNREAFGADVKLPENSARLAPKSAV